MGHSSRLLAVIVVKVDPLPSLGGRVKIDSTPLGGRVQIDSTPLGGRVKVDPLLLEGESRLTHLKDPKRMACMSECVTQNEGYHINTEANLNVFISNGNS